MSKPKANILGAKKAKIGAKKVDPSALDFDEIEKKAREDAERKEKLGYDPDEESAPSEAQINAAQPDSTSTIFQPKPITPSSAGGFGSTAQSRDRGGSNVDTVTQNVRKLGFGQIGGGAGGKAAAPKAMGFGSTGKAPVQGKPSSLRDPH